ncbi:AfsR/SARP family transcriptional regulator [Actinomycetospora aeridis]|uniref:AfsR/SARP family transcriptional regulator n=1 Tax=Actinomycetospora aeridis TaxID=3129231 RepID=A0ABU8N092_9PSEU
MTLTLTTAPGDVGPVDGPRAFDDALDPDVRFALLGRLEVVVHGRDMAPTAPRALQLLALLLLRPRQVVPTDTIVAELWGDRPPKRARAAVQTHVYQLRQCFSDLGLAGDPDRVLVTRAPGYALEVDPARTDLHAFDAGCREGRDALAEGRVDEAAAQLRTAEDLWAGPPIANVPPGSVLAVESVELLERRRAVRSARIDADIDRGRHRELVGELSALVLAHPLDEGLHAQLIRVLGRCGRRSDAMGVFRRLRDVLTAELGVEPGDEVADAYAELLTLGADAA